MGRKSKSQYRHDLMKYHRDIDHTPLKKKPDMQDTLANQIREKIFNNIQSVPAVDIISKALHGARIFLKDITTHGYTPADIRGFFSALDFVSDVYVVVNNKKSPFITGDSLFVVKLGTQKHSIPVHIFRSALPQDIKNTFKHKGSFYQIYKLLFAAYGRKLIPIGMQ